MNKHLKKHEETKIWYQRYILYSYGDANQINLTSEQLNLIKYFISSNTSISEITNPFLRKLINIKLPGYFSFTEPILPSAITKLHSIFQKKLNNAQFICLIIDIWTNAANSDFIALAVVTTNSDFEQEIHTINMKRINEAHTAETIKKYREMMVNEFDFDKSKIISVVCDEASNLLRLFSQRSIRSVEIFEDNDPEYEITENTPEQEIEKMHYVDYSVEDVDREITSIIKEINNLQFDVNVVDVQTIEDGLPVEKEATVSDDLARIIENYSKIIDFFQTLSYH